MEKIYLYCVCINRFNGRILYVFLSFLCLGFNEISFDFDARLDIFNWLRLSAVSMVDLRFFFFFFIEKNTLDTWGYLIARRHAHTFTRNQNYSSSIHSTCNSIKRHVQLQRTNHFHRTILISFFIITNRCKIKSSIISPLNDLQFI